MCEISEIGSLLRPHFNSNYQNLYKGPSITHKDEHMVKKIRNSLKLDAVLQYPNSFLL
jgi:hypothetical protein